MPTNAMNNHDWLAGTLPSIVAQVTADLAECVGSSWAIAMSARDSNLVPVYSLGLHPDLTRRIAASESAPRGDARELALCSDSWAPKITCPVQLNGDIFAVLLFGPGRSGEGYSLRDRYLIEETVAHLCFLLSDRRMATKMGTELSQLQRTKRELASAREIQGRLFPSRLPAIPGLDYYGESRAAGELGGDFFDFAPGSTGSLFFTIGDVSGKGVPAAIVMAGLLASLRALTSGNRGDLLPLVRELNRITWEVSPDNVYATMFHGCIDGPGHRLRYVNAGHDAVLLLRNKLSRAVRLESTGTVLGLSTKAVFGQRSTPVESGDILVAVTDGITEASDAEGHVLDEAVILSAVREHPDASSSDLAGYIIGAVDSFLRGRQPDDDRTVVVVRFNDNQAEYVPLPQLRLAAFAHAA
ncbi:MAG: PP2C family protein-serine/threonine phosphatase [Acidobacteriota bacterium]|nr:PP2C family protein-serine/threonine phosphatase [Acidobacteriota bacterium]